MSSYSGYSDDQSPPPRRFKDHNSSRDLARGISKRPTPHEGMAPPHALAWQGPGRKAAPRALPLRMSNILPDSKTLATSGSALPGNGDDFFYGYPISPLPSGGPPVGPASTFDGLFFSILGFSL